MTVKEFLQPFYAAAPEMLNVNLYDKDGKFFFIPVVAGKENLVPARIGAVEVETAKLDTIDNTPLLVINEKLDEEENAE